MRLSKIGLLVVSLLSFFNIYSSDYYWVGGTGLWSEVDQHWATTSGGTTFHSIVPTSVDDVYFDANSFTSAGETVTIDGSFANCRNIDWTGVTNTPEFAGPNTATLYVFGSLAYSTNMLVNLFSMVDFQANTPGKTLLSQGNRITQGTVKFTGVGGEWSLLDSLTVSDDVNAWWDDIDPDIYITAGKLVTNGFPVWSDNFYGQQTGSLDMSNSTFHVNDSWNISGSDFSVDATNSIIHNHDNSTGSVSGGNGNTLNQIIFDNSGYIYGDTLAVENIYFTENGTFSAKNSEVNRLESNGSLTRFSGGENYVHTAIINSTTGFTISTPAWYQNYDPTHEFDSLVLTSPGVTVTFPATFTQTINNYFELNGDCNQYATLTSDLTGSQVLLVSPVDVTINFVNMSDIGISGGAVYTADNSIDIGGNTGWVINEPAAQTLYWIGDGGDWGDGQHWSLTSGGAPYGCPPSAKDDVFFDANSFSTTGQEVEITATANCKNMVWSGINHQPEFTSSAELNVFGSLTYSPDMTVSIARNINFSSCTAGNTITSAGHRLTSYSAKFLCSTGEWTMLDSLYVGNDMLLNAGSLTSGGYSITSDEFIIEDNTFLNIENSSVYQLDDGWEIGTGVTLQAANSKIYIERDNWGGVSAGTGYTYWDVYLNGTSTSLYSNQSTFHHIYMNGNSTTVSVTEGQVEYLESSGAATRLSGDQSVFQKAIIKNSASFQLNTSSYSADFFEFDTLIFETAGVSVNLQNSTVTVNNVFELDGNCSAYSTLRSLVSGETVYIQSPKDITVSYVNIIDVSIGSSAIYQANSSIDGGGNTGWVFAAPAAQTLYWIGDSGDWGDGQKWSLTSGGAPLGCAPSPLDNAIFDDKSFSSAGQTVTVSSEANARNIDWSTVTNSPEFAGSQKLNIYGSLTYSPDMTIDFEGQMLFKSCELGNTITTANHELLSYISFECSDGEWTLTDSLKTNRTVSLNAGSLITDAQTVNASSFYAKSDTKLNIEKSVFNLTSTWSMHQANNVDFKADSSLINARYRFQGGNGYDYWDLTTNEVTYSYYSNNLSFNVVTIKDNEGEFNPSNTSVNVLIVNSNAVELSGSGNVIGKAEINSSNTVHVFSEYVFDTLNLNTAGQNIVLASNKTQTINDVFNIAQTSGFPIYISATTQGVQGHINFLGDLPACSEYLFLRDNNIYGQPGMKFFAGLNSDDISNNSGWLFESNSDCNQLICEFVGVEIDLGNDTTFCSSYELDAGDFQLDVGYQWIALSEGEKLKDTLQKFTVTSTDTVVVNVATEVCNISDTIVLTKTTCSINETILCEEDSTWLVPSKTNLSYTWNTGALTDSIKVTTDGYYWVDILDGGVTTRDSFLITKIILPALDLGNDTTICNGATYSYTADAGFDSYLWSFGGTTADYTTDTAAHVWLEASIGSCKTSDTVNIQAGTVQLYGLGNDTTFCPGIERNYTGTLAGMNFEWENGQTGFEVINRKVDTAGLYWLEVSANGCVHRDSILISYTAIDSVDLGVDTSTCNGTEVVFSVPVGYDTYLWNDGSTNDTLSVTTAGAYWVEATVGNCKVGDTVLVDAYTSPSFDVPDTEICPGENYEVNLDVTGHYFEWENGTTGVDLIARDFDLAGIYWLEIGAMGCNHRDTFEITTGGVAPFDLGADTILCDGNTLSFVLPMTYDSYLWNDGSTSSNFSTATAGTYVVEVSSGTCTFSDTIKVDAYTSPSFDVPDTEICPGENYEVNLDVTGHYFEWENGTTGVDLIARDFDLAGIYWLEIGAMGCNHRDTFEITTGGVTPFDLGADTILCDGNTLSFALPTTYDSYLWSDGSTSSNFSTATAGTYAVEVSSGTCTFSDTIKIEAYISPSFDVPDTEICPGENYEVNLDFTGHYFEWENGTTGVDLITRDFDLAGVYWLEIGAMGCNHRDTFEITTGGVTPFDLGADTILCDGNTLSFALPTTYDSYLWSDGSTSSNFSTATAGTYAVEVSSGTCTFSDTIKIATQNAPVFDLGNDTTICFGESLLLNPQIAGASYEWNTGEKNQEIEVDTTGVYQLKMTVNTCSSLAEIKLEVLDLPQVNLGNDTSICENSSLILDSKLPNLTYEWSTGEVTQTIKIQTQGLYKVKVTDGLCSGEDEITVTTVALPNVDLGGDTVMCEGSPITLKDFTTVNKNYSWSTGETSPTITVSAAGDYHVIVTSGNGCVDSAMVSVLLGELPSIDLGEDAEICGEGEVEVNPQFVGDFSWDDGYQGESRTIELGGFYYATSTTSCGTVTDVLEVKARLCATNAFTPNGDGINETWVIHGIESYPELHVKIYNRWGALVHESDDYQNDWAGLGQNGEPLVTGAYYYILSHPELPEGQSGNITLIK